MPPAASVANVILRYRLQDLPEPSSKAPALFEAIHAARTSDPVTLSEVTCVLASLYRVPPAEIVSGLEPIVKHGAFRALEEASYQKAPRLYPGGVAFFVPATEYISVGNRAPTPIESLVRLLGRKVDGSHTALGTTRLRRGRSTIFCTLIPDSPLARRGT